MNATVKEDGVAKPWVVEVPEDGFALGSTVHGPSGRAYRIVRIVRDVLHVENLEQSPRSGTGEPYAINQPKIADRCPSCGSQSLFIGSGGWLTCSVIGCKEPGVTREINHLRKKLEQPPPELIDKWMQNELADFRMVMDHCSHIYDWASRGRISKPNTLPEEVIRVAEDLQNEDIEEAAKEAHASLVAALENAQIVLLPMARGYAQEHNAGNNRDMVDRCERVLREALSEREVKPQ